MTRYLLDTNILRNITKPLPSASLVAWMANQTDGDLFIASLTVAEIRCSLLEKRPGRKRSQLERWFSGPEGLQALFADRILAFDLKAALIWARLMADGKTSGQLRSAVDMIIAAVAEANNCVLVTDNGKQFAGLKFFDPSRIGTTLRQSN